MDFLFTYHPLWIALAIGIAFAYSLFLYRKDELLAEVPSYLKWVLGILRFTAVFTILILIIGIIVEQFIERKERPLLFVVNDNSASILLTKDSTFYRTKFIENLDEIGENLNEKFDVQRYSFASELTSDVRADYLGKSTDLSTIFNSIFDQYTNRNIGGIIVASDGIYNAGANPLYAIARKSFLPIFTIGMGDTNLVKDVRLDKVYHNDIAFLGNEFPVEMELSETLCGGENVLVQIKDGDQVVAEQRIEFNREYDQRKLSFILKASRLGYRKYTVQVSSVKGEYSLKNNSANFYIEIIDGRQKILIAHQAPHPDIGALRYAIEKNKNYEVEVKQINKIESLKGYDLVVVHNFIETNPILTDYIFNGTGPVLNIVGGAANFDDLVALKIGFSGRSSSRESIHFAQNPNFKDIILSPKEVQVLSKAPPLDAPFGNISFSNAVEILAYQKVGNIELDNPMIYFTRKRDQRMGVIMGDGFWRWRLFDQSMNQTTENFEAFFNKLITFLAIKENKDPFKVQLENEYTENQEVVIKAELYNKSFDRVNDPEVKFVYSNEKGEEFESYFVKNQDAYQLSLGRLNQGVYTWEASTDFQGQKFVKKGTFIVHEVKIEFLNSVANHRVLRDIASASNGKFYFPNQLDELEKDIVNREDMVTVVYQEKEFDDLIDYKWIFILIVLLFAIEWFVRKFQGAY